MLRVVKNDVSLDLFVFIMKIGELWNFDFYNRKICLKESKICFKKYKYMLKKIIIIVGD